VKQRNIFLKYGKRLLLLTLSAGIIFSVTSASSWEGASVMAPVGALPEKGYYAATNLFPVDTVINIVNLETGKNIQAIVRDNTSTPGGIVLLSREAADAIGMRIDSIGRIRITQPSEDIAYSRFIDGRTYAGGDPDFDPKAAINTYGFPEGTSARNLTGQDLSAQFQPPSFTVIPDSSASGGLSSSRPAVNVISPAYGNTQIPSIVSTPSPPAEPLMIIMPSPIPDGMEQKPAQKNMTKRAPAVDSSRQNILASSLDNVPSVISPRAPPYEKPYMPRDDSFSIPGIKEFTPNSETPLVSEILKGKPDVVDTVKPPEDKNSVYPVPDIQTALFESARTAAPVRSKEISEADKFIPAINEYTPDAAYEMPSRAEVVTGIGDPVENRPKTFLAPDIDEYIPEMYKEDAAVVNDSVPLPSESLAGGKFDEPLYTQNEYAGASNNDIPFYTDSLYPLEYDYRNYNITADEPVYRADTLESGYPNPPDYDYIVNSDEPVYRSGNQTNLYLSDYEDSTIVGGFESGSEDSKIFSMVTADERPPPYSRSFSSELIFNKDNSAPPIQAPDPITEPVFGKSALSLAYTQIIPEYDRRQEELPSPPVRDEPLVNNSYIPHFTTAADTVAKHVVPEPEETYISDALPRIQHLEKGKYYLQLGTFGQKKKLDEQLSGIKNNYPLLIQTSGKTSELKLMVGPMNEGESNAVLQRFKRDGFKNAFIRHDG
jgi:hypothetical protein